MIWQYVGWAYLLLALAQATFTAVRWRNPNGVLRKAFPTWGTLQVVLGSLVVGLLWPVIHALVIARKIQRKN